MLAATGLECVRGSRRLFSGIGFALEAGGLPHLEGVNGSGKTSLLRMVCGLLQPTRGEILWRGLGIRKLGEQYHVDIAYLGHANRVKDELSALENLRISARWGRKRERQGRSTGVVAAGFGRARESAREGAVAGPEAAGRAGAVFGDREAAVVVRRTSNVPGRGRSGVAGNHAGRASRTVRHGHANQSSGDPHTSAFDTTHAARRVDRAC